MYILFCGLLAIGARKGVNGQTVTIQKVGINFYDDSIIVDLNNAPVAGFSCNLSGIAIKAFYDSLNTGAYQPLVQALLNFKQQNQLDDWLYYQLIRKAAQQLSPKQNNYFAYTLYKWFLLVKSGYDARLAIGSSQLLFYVFSKDSIYDLPFYIKEGRQYVCLNYHDYGNIDFSKDSMRQVDVPVTGAANAFSYIVTKLPEFKTGDYTEKALHFNYHKKNYQFNVALNPQVQNIFNNYPVVDFGAYFNIPLSKQTYNTLIPRLKKVVAKMNEPKGVDFLMRFTREAFLYETDEDNFGKEKHMSPEETLLYQYSDCDDRAALFFYLVKEIYNLPMITILYPTHVVVAVKFDKPLGAPVMYNGDAYTICDPTQPNLLVGQLADKYTHQQGKVVYAYQPATK